MQNDKLLISTRAIVAICGFSLIAVMFVPMWRIDLNAPQYPEGLSLAIHANRIKGNVDIINGLNHYIGMKTLHDKDFPEFTILPWCIGFFIGLFLLVALLNRRKWFYASFFLFVAFGIIAMADFWRWEYNYGHNLDPHAAIIVPGMAYQPPLIGYKQLLNFAAYSIPDTGGWIFIGCGVLLMPGVFFEWRKSRKAKKIGLVSALLLLPLFLLSSCSTGPEAIKTGSDNCAFCKMTISDPRFGAEIVTHTGKAFKFDDIHCMVSYYDALDKNLKKTATVYLSDFCGNHTLVPSDKCILLLSKDFKCPMDGHIAAFSSSDSMERIRQTYPGEKTELALNK